MCGKSIRIDDRVFPLSLSETEDVHVMDKPIWTPSAMQMNHTNITAFRLSINGRYGLDLRDTQELYNWSICEPGSFWSEVVEFTGIKFRTTAENPLQSSEILYESHWFEGATLNFAENLLRYRDDRLALVFRGEAGERRTFSYAQLYDEVSRLAAALREQGVGVGDRVAGFMPNLPETVIAMLAAASLGAIWSSCSPDFGVQGVIDRFGQIEPVVLFTADGYNYGGKRIESLSTVREVCETLTSIRKVVVVPYLQEAQEIEELCEAELWEDFLAGQPTAPIDFVPLPFDHPLYIMYSSGTTGLPKSIVHGAGGTLLQHAKELVLHTDLKRKDTIFYFTTCGWMMWNWLISSLFVGATVVLYDGNPFFPDGNRLWKMADEEKLTHFGTSAKYLQAVENAGLIPGEGHDLSELRVILSTGSPLAPEQFDWVYGSIKSDLQLASISGGTDIISCFALGDPSGPVWRGELQTRGLGMAVEIFDETGRSLAGEKGELVCTAPFPSMPVGFWNDEGGSRYRAAYFERFGGSIWHHGDYAELTEHGGLIIYGRSDSVLNPGGVRIGTAEIYRVVEQFEEVAEAICVGQRWNGDVRIILFLKMSEGYELTDELRQYLKRRIREEETPRHIPSKIIQVADIPRTISGKITEVAVRKVIHGEEVGNRDALKNPEALEYFRDLSELNEE